MFSLTALMGFLLLSGIPAHAQAPSALVQPSYTVTLTAYNAVPEQTDNDPLITASGAFSNPEIVVARSSDLADELPFGTIIEIVGPSVPSNSCGYKVVAPVIGYRVIADAMNPRYTNRIDILFHTKNSSTVLGICGNASVRVVGHIDIKNPNKLPKTQKELTAIIATL